MRSGVERVKNGASPNIRDARDFIHGDDGALNAQTDYRAFRKKIGAPVRQSQEVRIDEFIGAVGILETTCGNLDDIYVERLYDQEFEAIVAKIERAQRDLKRFLKRVRTTYTDRIGQESDDPDGAP